MSTKHNLRIPLEQVLRPVIFLFVPLFLLFTLTLCRCTSNNPMGVSLPGDHWVRLNFPLNTGYPTCIAMTPDGTLYLGTSSKYKRDYISILYSTDDGASWRASGLQKYPIVQITFDDYGDIFALSEAGNFLRKLSGSEDWELAVDGLGDIGRIGFKKIAVHPDSGIFYCIGGSSPPKLFVSYDRGDSWQRIQSLPDSVTLRNIAIAGDGRIFVAGSKGIWRTTDPAAGWDKILAFELSYDVGIGVNSKGDIYVGYSGDFVKSRDDGVTWTSLGEYLPYGCRYPLEILFDRQDNIYARTYCSWYYSQDGGWMWDRVEPDYCFKDFFVNDPGEIFVTWYKVSRTRDFGEHWDVLGVDDSEIIEIVEDESGNLFAATSRGTIYKSDDMGSSWHVFNTGFMVEDASCMTRQGDTILIGRYSIFRSPTDEPSWEEISYISQGISSISCKGDSIVIGTGSGVEISEDGGESWKHLGLKEYPVCVVVLGRDGAIYAGTIFSGVFRYTGKADIWDQVCTGLGSLRIVSMVESADGTLYAGTNDGVYEFDRMKHVWRDVKLRLSSATLLTKTESGRVVAVNSDAGVFLLDGGNWHHFPLDFGEEHFITCVKATREGYLFFYDYYNGICRSSRAIFE